MENSDGVICTDPKVIGPNALNYGLLRAEICLPKKFIFGWVNIRQLNFVVIGPEFPFFFVGREL